MQTDQTQFKDHFFISHRGSRTAEAKEVAGYLQDAGYSYRLQSYDFPLSGSFPLEMHRALIEAQHLVVLYCDDYDKSPYTMAEFTNFWAAMTQNSSRRIILIRVQDCMPRGLFAAQIFADLVTLTDPDERRAEVLRAVQGQPPMRRPEAPIIAGLPSANLHFVGREAELSALNLGFLTPDAETRAITQAVLHGLAGMGKSSLAATYAHNYGFHYSGIAWLNAETEAGYLDSLARFGERLDPGLATLDDLPLKARHTLDLIERRTLQKPVLLIFDNLPSAADLRGKPPARGAHVLITSRSALWGGQVKPVPIGELSPQAASTLLIRRSGVNDPEAAAALAVTLGRLPLALEQAAATIAAEGLGFTDYARNLQRYLDQIEDSTDYPKSVAATVHEALSSAMSREPAVERMMQILSLLAPDPLPMAVLDAAMGEARGRVVKALQQVSLIRLERNGAGEALVIVHRLTQMVLRYGLGEKQGEMFTEAIAALFGAMPRHIGEPPARVTALALAPHFPGVEKPANIRVEDYRRMELMNHNVGECYADLGLTALAEEAYLRSINFAETMARMTPENTESQLDLSIGYHRLGTIAQKSGNRPLAQDWFEKGLRIATVLAKSYPQDSRVQLNLSVFFSALGHLAKDLENRPSARNWFNKSLKVVQNLLKTDPLNANVRRAISFCYGDLGEVALATGNVSAARKYFKQTQYLSTKLAEQEPKNLTLQHDLSVVYDRLARFALKLGDLATARVWYGKAFLIDEYLASFDPDNVEFQRALIVSLTRLAELGEAEETYLRRALQIAEDLHSNGRLATADVHIIAGLRGHLAHALNTQ